MAILTKEAILAANDLAKELVSVPEWGGDVYIASMTGAARDAWEQSLLNKGGGGEVNMQNLRARLVAYTAVDEEGKRLFSDKEAQALGEKSAKALERCVKVAQRLNGLTDTDMEEAKGN